MASSRKPGGRDLQAGSRPPRVPVLAGLLTAMLLTGCAGPSSGGAPAATSSPAAAATACTGRLTPAQTEGPYYKAGSPERTSLIENGMPGTPLRLTGLVLAVDCRPIGGALLDFWQADASGVYDNSGYRLRGHQHTDADGRYSLSTIVPVEYPGRTAHIHVKVQPPEGPLLTTQLYFPGESRNQLDSIFDPALLMAVQDSAGNKTATFNFIVQLR